MLQILLTPVTRRTVRRDNLDNQIRRPFHLSVLENVHPLCGDEQHIRHTTTLQRSEPHLQLRSVNNAKTTACHKPTEDQVQESSQIDMSEVCRRMHDDLPVYPFSFRVLVTPRHKFFFGHS